MSSPEDKTTKSEANELQELDIDSTYQLYGLHVDEASQRLTEVKQRRDELLTAGREIIKRYKLKPELFEDDGRTFVFMAISSRWGQLRLSNPGEEEFLHTALEMLAYEYSSEFLDFKSIVSEAEAGAKIQREQAYEKYNDPRLATEIKNALSNGLLKEVRKKMGITSENEDEFEVRVLTVAADKHLYGIQAPTLEDRRDFLAWKQGLNGRADDFLRAEGSMSEIPPAWVTYFGDRKLLCLTMPMAEKILNPELTAHSPYYNQSHRDDELAYLAHEYTHTQGGLAVNNQVFFGVNVEELRAEHFSGNLHTYPDTAALFQNIATITGDYLPYHFDRHVKGGDAATVYEQLARNVGLSGALEVLMLAPEVYRKAAYNSPLLFKGLSQAFDYLGGYNGVLEKIRQHSILRVR